MGSKCPCFFEPCLEYQPKAKRGDVPWSMMCAIWCSVRFEISEVTDQQTLADGPRNAKLTRPAAPRQARRDPKNNKRRRLGQKQMCRMPGQRCNAAGDDFAHPVVVRRLSSCDKMLVLFSVARPTRRGGRTLIKAGWGRAEVGAAAMVSTKAPGGIWQAKHYHIGPTQSKGRAGCSSAEKWISRRKNAVT